MVRCAASVKRHLLYLLVFFFNDTATTEIYTLSLHDALPISSGSIGATDPGAPSSGRRTASTSWATTERSATDRKSTRLNSSHGYISYAVFCLKKKKKSQPDAGRTPERPRYSLDLGTLVPLQH